MCADAFRGAGTPVALVTGATSGLGKAIARALAEAGWKTYGTGRNPAVPEEGSGVPPILPMDQTSDQSVDALFRQVAEREGRLDLLIACAGMGIAGPVEETDMSAAARQMDVNFLGTARVVRAALPVMRSAGGGSIIIVGSIAGRIGVPFQAYYSASKFALEGFTESLRHEVRPFGIQICILEPGDFNTGFTDARVRTSAPGEGPYGKLCAHALAMQEKDERNGADPESAAGKIVSLLSRRRLPIRATVGSAFQRIATFIKRLIPSSWFEAAFRMYYGLGK